jgi:hypothetical protein
MSLLDPLGLFDNEYKFYAFAGSTSLYETLPDQFLSEILQESLDTTTPFEAHVAVQNTLNLDLFARAKKTMSYAQKGANPAIEGGYVRGFPEANLNIIKVDPGQVELALTRAIGDWDEIVSMSTGTYHEEFWVEKAMQDSYPSGLQWSGTAVDMDPLWHRNLPTIKIPVVNPDTGLNYSADNSPSINRMAPGWEWDDEEYYSGYIGRVPVALNRFKVTFPYIDNTGTAQEYTTGIFDISEAVSGEWIEIRYKLADIVYYWAYKIGSNDDPDLELYILSESKNAQFMPVAVIQHDRVWFNDDPDSELAKTTNKLLKYWALDGDQVVEDFLEAEAENPEQSGDHWDFHIHWGTPIRATGEGSKQYLWYFFQEMEDWSAQTADAYYEYLASADDPLNPVSYNYTKAQPISEINITEAGITGYNVDYRWSFINTVSFTGKFQKEDTNPLSETFGDMVDLQKGRVHKELQEWKFNLDPEYTQYIEDMFGPGTAIPTYPLSVLEGKPDSERYGYHDYVVLWRQRHDHELEEGDDPEVGRYDMTIVMGLSMQYKINTAESGDYRFRYAIPMLFGDEEETREFRIAMHYGVLQQVPRMKREEAIGEAFTATVFVVVVEKISWYQTSFWRWMIVSAAIAAIVLTLIYGPGWTKVVISSIASFLGGSAIAVWVATTIFYFAMSWIFSQAAITIAQEFGLLAAIIFMVFAAITMFSMQGGFQNIKSQWAHFQNAKGWMNAAKLLDAVRPIYDIGFQAYAMYQNDKYQQELADFMKDAKEKQQELNDAYANLTTPTWIDPLDIARVFVNNGAHETANTYFNRVLNTNPGLLGYEAITNFHKLALIPPKVTQSGTIVDALMIDLAEQRGEI